jgi:hypothetical protein
VGRILRVIVALFLSVFTGAITLAVLSARWALGQFEDAAYATDPVLPLGHVAEMMIYSVEFAPALTLLPALAAVILGEVLRIRSVLYYVATGGIAAVIVPASAGLMALTPVGAAPGAIAPGLPIFATAGFAAGFMYWLIAGRRA